MKRRLLALLTAMALLLTLTACGGTEDAAEDENAPAQETVQPEDGISDAAPEDGEDDAAPEETEDPAEEPVDETPAEEGNTAANPGSGSAGGGASGSKPAGEQNTAGQKPAQEQRPAEEKPAQDETVSQPAEPEAPAEPAAEGVDLAAFYNTLAGGETWPGMMAVEGEALSAFYPGLADIAAKQCLVYYSMISATVGEIALVEVENSADVETVKGIFQARIDYQVGDGENPGGAWYPASIEGWQNGSRIVSHGNYVMLIALAEGADDVVSAFNALFA